MGGAAERWGAVAAAAGGGCFIARFCDGFRFILARRPFNPDEADDPVFGDGGAGCTWDRLDVDADLPWPDRW